MTTSPPEPGALCEALINFDMDCAEELLRQGADPNERNADYNETALHLAVISDFYVGNSCDMPKLLIEAGADVNATDNRGQTPLMWAVTKNVYAIEFLIEKGASLDIKDHEGRTALDWAKTKHHTTAIETLTKALALQQQQTSDQAAANAAMEAEQQRIAVLHNTAIERQEALKRRRPRITLRLS